MQINKLRNRLLKQNQYQRMSRPVKRHSTQTNVSLTLFFRRVVNIDHMSSSMTSFATVLLEWKDEHLSWNPSDFGGLDEINFDYWEIWTPDIRSWDVIDGNSGRQMGKEPMKVNSSGYVSWWTRAVFTSSCFLDLKDFPFDTQSCSIYFMSWTYDIRHLNITKNPSYKNFIYGPYQKNPEWSVADFDSNLNTWNDTEAGYYPSLGIFFTFKRRTPIYTFRTFLPYVAAMFIAMVSFFEPPGSGRRLLLSSISISLLMVIMVQLADQLGPHSISVPYAIKCVGVSIVVISSSILSSLVLDALTRKLCQRNILLPRLIMAVVENSWIQMILLMRSEVDTSSCRREQNELSSPFSPSPFSSSSSQVITKEWILLGRFVDRLCLLVLLVVLVFYHM